MITIKDIAEITGVSPTTVANVIHGRTNKVSKDNVKKIQAALNEYQYVPKLAQETMTRGKTRLIGVLIHTTKVYTDTTIADPFYGMVVGVLEREIRQAGYYMLLYTEMDVDEIFKMSSSWSLAGMITVTFAEKDYAKLSFLCGNRPVVGIDTYGTLEETDYNVGLDDVTAGMQITDYLFLCGYEDVLILSEQNAKGADLRRVEGYRLSLEKHGKSYRPKDHILVDPEFPDKREKKIKELKRHAGKNRAIFCVTDQLAVMVQRSFLEDGYQIPQDIAIAGFDDNAYARLCYPTLTTMRQDIRQKAIEAVIMLLKLIDGEEVKRRQVYVSSQLIVGQSTRKPAAE